MKHSFLIFLFFFFNHLFAQQKDSISKSYKLKEITISAPAFQHYVFGSRITKIDSSTITFYKAASLLDILQLEVPLYFKNYGQGQLNSVGFRGTSANHTAVLWNGFNINSPTSGSSDFAVLPSYGYNQIEIHHGSSAALWGTGGIGGSILISSKPVFGKGWEGGMQTEISRFGKGDISLQNVRYYSNQGNISYSNKRYYSSVSIWQNYAENNFPYHNFVRFGNPEVRQENAAFKQKGLSFDTDWRFLKSGSISSHVFYTNTYRQTQPAMTEGNNGNYRIDDSFRMMLSGQYKYGINETILKVAMMRDALNYNGANSPVISFQSQALHEITFSQKFSLKTGFEYQHFDATISDNYSKTEKRASVFLLSYFQPFNGLNISFNLRQAFVTTFNPPFTPHLGAEYQIYRAEHTQLSLKGNVGKSYRVPTLHDRYWIGGGNPEIRPENSFGYEGGLTHTYFKSRFLISTQLNYFNNLVRDWIQWTPSGAQGLWSPKNVLNVKTQGLEFTSDVSFSNQKAKFNAGIRYYLNKAVYENSIDQSVVGKQLEYTPLHNILFNLKAGYKKWFGSLVFTFTGRREIFGYDGIMPPYSLANAMLGKNVKLQKNQFQILIKCNNFFNTQYQTYGYYAMPGRNYTLSLRFQFHP